MLLISQTYWTGGHIKFRYAPEGVSGRPVALNAKDGARIRGLYWTPDANPNPKVAVVAAHPRVDFQEHHTFPKFLEAGYGCLGANTRTLNNDADCLHEKLLFDIAAYLTWLQEEGVEKIVLMGNSGGGSLFSFYQAQAKATPDARIRMSPDGGATGLDALEMPVADALIFLAAHTGQGLIMNEVIDGAVIDEDDPLLTDPALDIYDARNGFRPPPEWSRYDPAFLKTYRAAQLDRVRRIDAGARDRIAFQREAERMNGIDEFNELPLDVQRRSLRREAFEPLMLVYRTMANPAYVDDSIDFSNRAYGSLLSPRPDLMNYQRLGFGRVVAPRGWLSTWSGLSSNANILESGLAVTEPALVVNAGRDLDVHPQAHSRRIFDTLASTDKTYVEFPDALHYFEPDDAGDKALNDLMDCLVPWVAERFPV